MPREGNPEGGDNHLLSTRASSSGGLASSSSDAGARYRGTGSLLCSGHYRQGLFQRRGIHETLPSLFQDLFLHVKEVTFLNHRGQAVTELMHHSTECVWEGSSMDGKLLQHNSQCQCLLPLHLPIFPGYPMVYYGKVLSLP